MATIHGVAGEWARVKGTVLGLWSVFLCIFAAGFSVAIFFAASARVGAVLFLFSLIGFAFAIMKGLHRVERFFKGARGEERVSLILKTLPDEYHVFNDFIACGVHIDHVVVGPAGVFAVETKNWRGRVTIEEKHILVDGQLPSRNPLAQATREARLVAKQLEKSGCQCDVTPVLAFASDTFSSQIAELNGAVIMNSCDLSKNFASSREVLPSPALERLVSLMENLG